jgi:hypothetical protein
VKQKQTAKQEIMSLAESQLGQILSGLLTKITAIKKRHEEEKESPIKAAHAWRLLLSIENICNTLYKVILPSFYNNKTPSLFDKGRIVVNLGKLSEIKNSKKLLYTREYVLFKKLKKEFPNIIDSIFSKKINILGLHFSEIKKEIIEEIIKKFSDKSFTKEAFKIPVDAAPDSMLENIESVINRLTLDIELDKDTLKKALNRIPDHILNNLFNLNKPKYKLIIDHEMTLELTLEILNIIGKLPSSLKELTPFFNPLSIVEILKNKDNSVIKKINDSDYTDNNPYQYNAINNEETKKIDVNNYYKKYIRKARKELAMEIYKNFPGNVHVKGNIHINSEIAKSDLVKELNEREAKFISINLETIRYEFNLHNSFQEESTTIAIEKLKEKIQNENDISDLSSLNNNFINHLKQKIDDYDKKSIRELLEDHKDLIENLDDNTNKGLIDYTFEPLPNTAISHAIDNDDRISSQIIPIKKSLIKCAKKALKDAEGLQEQLTSKLFVLNCHKKIFAKKWHEEEINKQKTNNDAQLNNVQTELNALSSQVSECISTKRSENIDEEIEIIIGSIRKIDQFIQSIQQLNSKIEQIRLTIESALKLPHLSNNQDLLASFDQDYLASLQNVDVMCIYNPLLAKASEIVNSVKLAKLDYEDMKKALETRLKLAQLNKEYAGDLARIDKLIEITKARCGELTLAIKKKTENIKTNDNLRNAEVLNKNNFDKKITGLNQNQADLIKEKRDLVAEANKTILDINTSQNIKEISSEEDINVEYLDKKINDSKNYIDSIKNEYPEDKKNEISSQIKALNTAKEFLDKSKGIIPFKELDELDELLPFKTEKPKKISGVTKRDGFSSLLNILGLTYLAKSFKFYRSRQDDTLAFLFDRPTPQECNGNIDLLSQHVNDKINVLQIQMNLYQSLFVCEENINKLEKVKIKFNDNKRELSGQANELAKTTTLLNNSINAVEELNLKIKDDERSLELSINENISLEFEIEILTRMSSLSEEIKSINNKVNELNFIAIPKDDMYNNKDRISTEIERLKDKYRSLENKYSDLAARINTLDNRSAYEANLKALKSVLDLANANITLLIQGSILTILDKIDSELGSININYDKAKNSFDNICNSSDYIDRIDRIEMLKAVISKNIYSETDKIISQITSLETNITQVNDAACTEKYIRMKKNIEKLRQQLSNLNMIVTIGNKLTKINSELNSKIMIADIFNRPINTRSDYNKENKIRYQDNAHSIEYIESYLDPLLNTLEPKQRIDSLEDDFKSSQSNNVQLNNEFQKTRDTLLNLNEILENSKTANNALGKRINDRESLADECIKNLDKYLVDRNKKYNIKDAFITADFYARTNFIGNLKNELNAYAESGESQKILDYINKEKTNFPGVNLTSILNRIVIDVLKIDKTIPVDYSSNIVEEKTDPSKGNGITLSLFMLKQTNETNYNKIKHLFETITAMESCGQSLLPDKKGQDAIDLAKELSAEANAFVRDIMTGANFKPDHAANFQNYFLTLLHSKDDSMAKHKTSWVPVVANIAIAIIPVIGLVALGIKLVHSKRTTGYCSFFFNETIRQKQVAAIEESVKSLASPAAA